MPPAENYAFFTWQGPPLFRTSNTKINNASGIVVFSCLPGEEFIFFSLLFKALLALKNDATLGAAQHTLPPPPTCGICSFRKSRLEVPPLHSLLSLFRAPFDSALRSTDLQTMSIRWELNALGQASSSHSFFHGQSRLPMLLLVSKSVHTHSAL